MPIFQCNTKSEPELKPTFLQAHREKVTEELRARKARLAQLDLALREIEMQRLLMGKGAKSVILPKKKKLNDDGFNEGNGGGDFQDFTEGTQAGLSTGARTFKWKVERKR